MRYFCLFLALIMSACLLTSCKDESKEKASNSSPVQTDNNPKTLDELSEKNRQLIKDNE